MAGHFLSCSALLVLSSRVAAAAAAAASHSGHPTTPNTVTSASQRQQQQKQELVHRLPFLPRLVASPSSPLHMMGNTMRRSIEEPRASCNSNNNNDEGGSWHCQEQGGGSTPTRPRRRRLTALHPGLGGVVSSLRGGAKGPRKPSKAAGSATGRGGRRSGGGNRKVTNKNDSEGARFKKKLLSTTAVSVLKNMTAGCTATSCNISRVLLLSVWIPCVHVYCVHDDLTRVEAGRVPYCCYM